MRIVKIELPGLLHAKDAGLNLDDPTVCARLMRELDGLRGELADRIRAKAAVYLPPTYTPFVRVAFDPQGAPAARVVVWIDDPTVTGVSGLLARRAWQLSVPILAHIVREAVQERLQTLAIEVDESRAKVSAFAPARGYTSPAAIALAVALLSALYWLYAHAALLALLRRSSGG